ncbi:putative cfxQ-like protein [Cotonvirus japonicus]|uniref:CfxQ-like protein n=1 Tax=Cotonvirus japonicus TaxID=2811091 RepID=A0ABM7NRZ3_9VIRU|nr:putative cfxQ-like protein [Cotonvirus japonicus]BCS82924.1 putative cfxQ-like protein [Cotonvirus japonicus]
MKRSWNQISNSKINQTDKNNSAKKINIDNSLPKIFFFLNDVNDINEIINTDPPDDNPIPPLCSGINCDHDEWSLNVPVIPDKFSHKKNINLQDLIDLGECYHCKLQQTFHGLSLERLSILRDSLIKLEKVIGMNSVKENFCEQIIYFLLDLEPNPAEMLHTIIEGPPGVGKTHVIGILAEIYTKMGYLTSGKINKIKLNDLKGKYVGHSAPLTQKAIDDSIGGILLLDEFYSLGSEGILDSFSKEIIDTLNRNLTENAGKFVCMIAGYGDQIEKCIFSHNIGLKSRFRFKFKIDSYNYQELFKIFFTKVIQDGWLLTDENEICDFFKLHCEKFKYYGRDMETLLFHTKIAHSKRIIFEPKQTNKIINLSDMEMGLQRFMVHNYTDIVSDISHTQIYL